MPDVVVRLWGRFADQLGQRELRLKAKSLKELRETLQKVLNSRNFSLAINETITNEDVLLNGGEVVDVIPPVSGG
ncbi:MAG: hypothetical protein GXO48_08850 [Chlorobi bacterium]|nr:hypothetical protein [Chlorobiota bacterium]